MNGGNYCSIAYASKVIMCNYLAAYSYVYLVACSNLRALLHAYLVGLEALDLLFV